MNHQEFIKLVWNYYRENARNLPWRLPEPDGSLNPYKILVSEIMLQQTQVERVIPKYETFLTKFPTIEALAQSELSKVMNLWSGLGYNRRAKYLLEAARQLDGKPFPKGIDALTKLNGIGHNTAAAVLTYSFNQPHVFVETNVRTVYIHHFFRLRKKVDDTEIMELLAETLDQTNPREFMWALMDYGSYLKRQGIHNVAQSKHYSLQPKFHGSIRELRGEVIRRAQKRQSLTRVQADIKDPRLEAVLDKLKKEGLIQLIGSQIQIAS